LTRGPSGLDPDRVGPGVGRPARVWGGSARALIATHLNEEEKPESVDAASLGRSAMWLDRPATTWRQTDLSKLVEVPFTPINTSSL
jgi:hypothetical protein